MIVTSASSKQEGRAARKGRKGSPPKAERSEDERAREGTDGGTSVASARAPRAMSMMSGAARIGGAKLGLRSPTAKLLAASLASVEQRPRTVPETSTRTDVEPEDMLPPSARRRRMALGAGMYSVIAGRRLGSPFPDGDDTPGANSTTPAPPGLTDWKPSRGWPPLMGWESASPPKLVCSSTRGSPEEEDSKAAFDRTVASRQGPLSPGCDEDVARALTLRPCSQANRWNARIAEDGFASSVRCSAEQQNLHLQRLLDDRAVVERSHVLRAWDAEIEQMDRSLSDYDGREQSFYDGLLAANQAEAERIAARNRKKERKEKKEKEKQTKARRPYTESQMISVGSNTLDTYLARSEALKQFQGGAIKRAAEALESRFVENVHDVPEVQKISSCVDRVGTKLEYYRDNDDRRGVLVEKIEKDYMAVEAVTQQPIVSVGRLRNVTSSHGKKEPGSGSDDTDSEMKSRSRSTLLPERVSPEVSSTVRSIRMESAQAKARDLDLDRRVDQLVALRFRMTRREEAERARPWAVDIVVCMMIAAFRSILVTYQQALEAATNMPVEAVQKAHSIFSAAMRQSSRRTAQWKEAVSKLNEQGLRLDPRAGDGCALLSGRSLVVIHRRAVRYVMMHDQTLRRNKLWRNWRHVFILLVAVVRFLRPYRRHCKMDLIKSFVDATWKGVQLRRTVKKWYYKIKLLQLHIRLAVKLSRVVRQRIIMPQIWVAETHLIAQAVGFAPEKMNAIKVLTDAYIRTCDVDVWRAKAANIIKIRDDLQEMHSIHVKVDQLLRISSRGAGRWRPADDESSCAPPRPPTGADPQELRSVLGKFNKMRARDREATEEDGGGEQHQDSLAALESHRTLRGLLGFLAMDITAGEKTRALAVPDPEVKTETTPLPSPRSPPARRYTVGRKSRHLRIPASGVPTNPGVSPYGGSSSGSRGVDGEATETTPWTSLNRPRPTALDESVTEAAAMASCRSPTHARGHGKIFGVSSSEGGGSRKKEPGKDTPSAVRAASEVAAEQEAAITLGCGALSVIEDYRLGPAQHEHLASRLYRARVNEWYKAHKHYKAGQEQLRRQWLKWQIAVLSAGGVENRELWPEPPSVPAAPAEILKDNPSKLRDLVRGELQGGRAALIKV